MSAALDTPDLPLGTTAAARNIAWRTLFTYSIYRVCLAVLLAIAYWGGSEPFLLGAAQARLATTTLVAYLALSLIMLSFVRMRTPSVNVQLSAQVLVDVIAIATLMHASGGVKSGLGILLFATLAASGLIIRDRLVYFHAAVASIAVLLEQAADVLQFQSTASEFFQSGLLAIGYFAIAALAATLARYAQGVERIAAARGIDLANLAQINQLVIRDMQDGFLVVDEKGRIRQHNAQSTALLGPLPPNVRLAEYAPRLAVFLQEWRRDHARMFPVVHDARTQKDYQVRFIAIGPQSPESEVFAPTVIFLEDVGRIRAQAQQMKLVALGRLTASIAHEIRNPLSSITHATDLLEEDEQRSESDHRLLQIIRDNAHRLDRMVQEVLYLNRRDRAHPEPIEADQYLRQFVHDFSGSEKIDRGVFVLELLPQARVLFDRAHLDQVLWNLSRNAWRHCRRRPGSIALALKPGSLENTLQLDVVDDGPGVSTSALPHLFEPFFTTDAQGTGLGLYIAREFAEVNGARLEYVAGSHGGVFRLVMKAA